MINAALLSPATAEQSTTTDTANYSDRATVKQAPLPAIIHPAFRRRRAQLAAAIFAEARTHDEFRRSLTAGETDDWAEKLHAIAERLDQESGAPLGGDWPRTLGHWVADTTSGIPPTHTPDAQARRARAQRAADLERLATRDEQIMMHVEAGARHHVIAAWFDLSISGLRKVIYRMRRAAEQSSSGSGIPPSRRNPEVYQGVRDSERTTRKRSRSSDAPGSESEGNGETVPEHGQGPGGTGGGIPPNRDGAPSRHIASVPGAVTDDSTGRLGRY